MPLPSRKTLVCAAAVGLLFLTTGCPLPFSPAEKQDQVHGVTKSRRTQKDAGLADKAFKDVNRERVRRGLIPLTRRADLDAVAYLHADDLVVMDKLSHVSSDGKQLEDRLKKMEWTWAGENLARNKGFDDPAGEAVLGWINSPRHNRNMFRPDFSQSGMAALVDSETGFTYFVQIFIVPGT